MTLQRTDVGRGQQTPGTSARSPELFIPLKAKRENESFWGYPKEFSADSTKPGKFDRSGVRVLFEGKIVTVNMMTWPDKSDFRLRCRSLRDAGNVGDIFVMTSVNKSTHEYEVGILKHGTPQHAKMAKICVNPVRNSKKTYCYFTSS